LVRVARRLFHPAMTCFTLEQEKKLIG